MKTPKTYYRRNLPHYHPPDATYHIVFRLAGSLPRHVIEELRIEREKEEKMIASIKDEKRKLDEWRAHHQAYFEKFDALLDGNTAGPRWLADDRVAEIVAEAIHYREAREYDLLAYTIMPNHVHMVITAPSTDTTPSGVRIANRTNSQMVERISTPFPVSENPVHEQRGSLFQEVGGGAVGRNTIPTYRMLQSLKRHTARKANTLLRRSGQFWQEESYDRVIRDGEELEHTIWYVLFNPVKAGLVESWEHWKWMYVKQGML
jgi:putative transposase